jgi:hypothetical protein
MDPSTIDPPLTSTCTSCIYREDTSNYWTASLYFRSPQNGTFRRVPQKANGRQNMTLLEQDGGLTVYYMRPFASANTTVTAMPRGFRMLAGDPTLRSASPRNAMCHRCLAESEAISGGSGPPCDANDYQTFPDRPCPGGIRATVIFPSCWDGVHLDSPDHRAHVAYGPGISIGGNETSALAGSKCPDTHPVRIPQVMYEVMFDTKGFAEPEYFVNGTQPLVYSFGDP